MTPLFAHVLIVGIGLIGGSVAAALRANGMASRISACGPGQDPQIALSRGLVDQIVTLPELLPQADLVVLACPPSAMQEVLRDIGSHKDALLDHVVITDCASTKQSVIQSAGEHLGSVLSRFVPGHPIAGSERRGPQAAHAGLFNGARWIVSPTAQTAPDALQAWLSVLAAWGCRVQSMDAFEHDRLYATVSHMPHAVAFALCAAIAASEQGEAALAAAGAGLRDTSRIGASDASLWADIVMDNQALVGVGLRQVIDQLEAQIQLLETNDRQGLEQHFDFASRWRRQLHD